MTQADKNFGQDFRKAEAKPEDKLDPLAKHPLDARKRAILSAVIQDYVALYEPVGSKALLSRHKLGVSSATVRNEMAELEELGYLEQPHTSAGRIPSDKGYRAYVDDMLQICDPSPELQDFFRKALAQSTEELQDLIRSAGDSLADTTQLTSLVLTPTYGESTLKQVKILMIEPGKAIVVVVLSVGVVQDRLIYIPDALSQEQLESIAQAVESSLAGQKLDEITLLAVTDAGQQEEIPDPFLNRVLFETYVAIKQAENIDVYMQGSHQLLKQPEFADIEKAHKVLDTISQNGLVAGYLAEIDPADQVDDQADQDKQKKPAFAIRIGQEIGLAGMEDCSFVTTSYRIGDKVSGRIAVVGPKRMPYSQIVSEIAFVKKTINHKIQEWTHLGNKDYHAIEDKGVEQEDE